MGEIFRILCVDKNNEENRTSLILKIAPRSLMRREKFNLHNLFRREIVMYEEVCCKFSTIYRDDVVLNLFENSRFFPFSTTFNYPKALFRSKAASMSFQRATFSESLFLEDLKFSHFPIEFYTG